MWKKKAAAWYRQSRAAVSASLRWCRLAAAFIRGRRWWRRRWGGATDGGEAVQHPWLGCDGSRRQRWRQLQLFQLEVGVNVAALVRLLQAPPLSPPGSARRRRGRSKRPALARGRRRRRSCGLGSSWCLALALAAGISSLLPPRDSSDGGLEEGARERHKGRWRWLHKAGRQPWIL